mmetsp:Transcript_36074/g.52880  ORF Transcript_36074/g.52880 Transcript_36074/m.52880 type:complete len:228 (-) Transcript_36074:28-711(-)
MFKAFFLATFAAILQVTDGLYFYLDNKSPRCFTETLDSHMLWAVQVWMPDLAEINDYRETDGLVDLFIDVVITELKTEQEVLKDSFESEGSVAFTASQDGGVYRVCFSRSSDKVLTDEDKLDELIRVDFDLEVEQYFEDKKINRDTVVQREHVTDLNEKLKRLKDDIDRINNAFDVEKENEGVIRQMAESNQGRILWLSVIQIAVLCVIGAWEVYYLKNFFISKKIV